jgi:hypothetical protein
MESRRHIHIADIKISLLLIRILEPVSRLIVKALVHRDRQVDIVIVLGKRGSPVHLVLLLIYGHGCVGLKVVTPLLFDLLACLWRSQRDLIVVARVILLSNVQHITLGRPLGRSTSHNEFIAVFLSRHSMCLALLLH